MSDEPTGLARLDPNNIQMGVGRYFRISLSLAVITLAYAVLSPFIPFLPSNYSSLLGSIYMGSIALLTLIFHNDQDPLGNTTNDDTDSDNSTTTATETLLGNSLTLPEPFAGFISTGIQTRHNPHEDLSKQTYDYIPLTLAKLDTPTYKDFDGDTAILLKIGYSTESGGYTLLSQSHLNTISNYLNHHDHTSQPFQLIAPGAIQSEKPVTNQHIPDQHKSVESVHGSITLNPGPGQSPTATIEFGSPSADLPSGGRVELSPKQRDFLSTILANPANDIPSHSSQLAYFDSGVDFFTNNNGDTLQHWPTIHTQLTTDA